MIQKTRTSSQGLSHHLPRRRRRLHLKRKRPRLPSRIHHHLLALLPLRYVGRYSILRAGAVGLVILMKVSSLLLLFCVITFNRRKRRRKKKRKRSSSRRRRSRRTKKRKIRQVQPRVEELMMISRLESRRLYLRVILIPSPSNR